MPTDLTLKGWGLARIAVPPCNNDIEREPDRVKRSVVFAGKLLVEESGREIESLAVESSDNEPCLELLNLDCKGEPRKPL